MMEIISDGTWLPLTFALLMGIALVAYAVLDGYDLGVGILSGYASHHEKDVMITSIGPFWDANETWLVLAVGLLLIAFPMAQGVILGALYLPVAMMLIGLIMRGVAFDFRVKAQEKHKNTWNKVFFLGSALTAFTQGYMLGFYVLGFQESSISLVFSVLSGSGVVAAYILIGACWLVMKTEGPLQKKAIKWARSGLFLTALGLILITLATPLNSARIEEKWTTWPEIMFLIPCPLLTAWLIYFIYTRLGKLAHDPQTGAWKPFAATVGIFMLSFIGLAYSFYPYIVPDQLKIVDAASGRESLLIILFGALAVLPVLIFYTGFSYKVFWGKVNMDTDGYADFYAEPDIKKMERKGP